MEKNFSDLIKESITDEEQRIANNSKDNSKPDLNTLRKKVRKNFFVGFGAGLMVAAAAFFIFKPADEPNIVSEQTEELTKEKINSNNKNIAVNFTTVPMKQKRRRT